MTSEDERLAAMAEFAYRWPEPVFLWRSGNGLLVPGDQGGFILTRAEYEHLKLELDEFYSVTPGSLIEDHNREKMDAAFPQHREPKPVIKPKPKPGYIYVIKGGDYYKIGRTGNMTQRMKSFSKSIPSNFDLVCSWRVDDMVQEEKELHEIFSESRVRGEWFSLNEDDVLWLCGMASFRAQHGALRDGKQ